MALAINSSTTTTATTAAASTSTTSSTTAAKTDTTSTKSDYTARDASNPLTDLLSGVRVKPAATNPIG